MLRRKIKQVRGREFCGSVGCYFYRVVRKAFVKGGYMSRARKERRE